MAKVEDIEVLSAENCSMVGLARFSTLKSWLSQWSYDESNANGPRCLNRVKAPILCVGNGSDHLVPLTHTQGDGGPLPNQVCKFFCRFLGGQGSFANMAVHGHLQPLLSQDSFDAIKHDNKRIYIVGEF